jgi:hypothetical protein
MRPRTVISAAATLLIRAVPAVLIVPLLAASGASAQERCKWSSEAGDSQTTYPQQLDIDVGDVPGHLIGAFQIHTVNGPNAKPNCEGLKNKESFTYGLRDYRDKNGHVFGYVVSILENGDKIYSQFSGTTMTVVGADGSKKTTNESVATWTGGTGRYQAVRGIQRDHGLIEWAPGSAQPTTVHITSDGEYWFEK